MSGEAALVETPNDGPLRLFLGVLHARRLNHGQAVPHLRRAADLLPDSPLPRIELARALVGAGHPDEADAALAGLSGRGPVGSELAKIRAGVAEAHAAAGRGEASLASVRAQASALPYDPALRVAIARLEDLLGRPELAETALREALALDPGCAPALLALADLAERGNRIDELETLLTKAEAAGIPAENRQLLAARLLYRRSDLQGALAAARAAPDCRDGGRRAELIGRISDRNGDYEAAFAAFTEMNRKTGSVFPDAHVQSRAYREKIAETARMVTPAWHRGWSPQPPALARPAPVFLLGFPRSGTTLLDTMLAGHDEVRVLEEKPVLEAAARALREMTRLPDLTAPEIRTLQRLYYEALDAAGGGSASVIIDKMPMALTWVPLIHRLFPEARIVFVERHPCDVVLGGFMARFDPRGAMANFLDLSDIARLYEGVMDLWCTCRTVLPLHVQSVRYERLVADPEAELRPLAEFLGLPWDGRLLDHSATARGRGHIGSSSYAQVTEPLHRRASERWRRYRAQLEPVLPMLTPWAAEMGYEM